MAGPWERYAKAPAGSPADGPWTAYAAKTEAPADEGSFLDRGTNPAVIDFGKRVGRQIGLTARAGLTNVTALPAMVGDALGMDSSGAVQRAADWIGLPKPLNATERVSQDVAGAMALQGGTVALGRGMAKAAGPVVSRVGEVLASNPGLQTVTAAAGTTAGSVTREQGGGPGAQLAANLGASLAVPAVAGMVKRNPMPADRQALIEESRRRDVPLTYADITGGGSARRLDTALEQVPIVGTSSFREAGAKKATSAIQGFAEDAKGTMQGTQYRGLDRLKDAATAGDKSAKNTLDQIQNAGEDWTKIMQSSGNLKLWRAREAATAMYDKVGELAATRGEVPLAGTTKALDSAIAAESTSKLPDKTLIAKLSEIKTNLGSGNDFNAMRQLRSDIGDLVQNYYKGANAAVGAKGVDKLQAVKNAVEGDMEAFATTSGGDLQRAWKRADSFYKTAVVPYKDKALAGALRSDLPDEIYRKFVQVGRSGAGEDRAQKFYDALDQKGRAAVRYGMIANAIDSAVIPEKQGLLSPGKFEQSLGNLSKASGVFFKGSDKAELDGFANLMEHARRFGQYQENPPTGQRVIPWLALGGAFLRPDAMAGVGGAAWGARQLMTTEGGKNFLLEASLLKAGTPDMERLVQEISKQIPRLLTQTSQAPEQRQQQMQSPRTARQ